MSGSNPHDSNQPTVSEVFAARLREARIKVFGAPFPPFRPWRTLGGKWFDDPLPGRIAVGSDLVPRRHTLKGRKP